MRASRAVLNLAHPVATRAPPPLVYNLGISYAAKHSPPFVPPNAHPGSQGFAGQASKLGRWVDTMKALPAGRGELEPTKDEHEAGRRELDLQVAVNKWGAGEDFFAVVSTDTFVSRV
jgi:protein phosphatase PTC7